MPLNFPTSSTAGDIYQSGSSAKYKYDGEKWTIDNALLNALTSSYALTASSIEGVELTELSDVTDNSTTASFGDLLVKSGSQWINSKQLTGSYGLSGSITMWQSASVSGANLIGTASQAETASFVRARLDKEWHVSSGSGDDTFGDGSILRPFKTLARASSSLGNTGERIILHPGTYRESVTFPQLNFSISTPGDVAPGEIYVSGTITLTGGSSSNKLGGFVVNSLVQSGNASLYLQSMTVIGTTTKSGTGYFEVQNSGLSQNSTVTISNSGTCVFQTSKVGIINQSHASSVVSILNCMTVVFPTATAGTALIKDSVVYSTASGSAACSYGASATVFLQNSSFYNPLGQAERINVSGLHGFDDCIFNRENSVTGSSLVSRAHFQHLHATALTGSQVRADFGLTVSNGTSFSPNRGHLLFASGSDVIVSGALYMAYPTGSTQTTGSNIFGTASWAMNVVNGGSVVTVSGSFPTGSNQANATGSATGSLWWNTEDGNLYIQVESPTGSEWVPAVNSVAGGQYGATVTTQQVSAATTWVVPHNLNTSTPIVQVYSGNQVLIPATITATTPNLVTITFASATAGTSVISTGVGGPTTSSFTTNSSTADVATLALLANTASFASQIVDRGSSGYIDIGSVRIQWGTESNINATGTTTLPVAFANNTYSLTLTNVSAQTNNILSTAHNSRSTTGFSWVKRLIVNGSATIFDNTAPFTWMAIGLKP